jgi:hypothetical protein
MKDAQSILGSKQGIIHSCVDACVLHGCLCLSPLLWLITEETRQNNMKRGINISKEKDIKASGIESKIDSSSLLSCHGEKETKKLDLIKSIRK